MKNRNDISRYLIKSVIVVSLFLILVLSSNFSDLGKLTPFQTSLRLHQIDEEDVSKLLLKYIYHLLTYKNN